MLCFVLNAREAALAETDKRSHPTEAAKTLDLEGEVRSLRDELLKQGRGAVAKFSIGILGTLLALAVTGWGLYAKDVLTKIAEPLPRAALVLFPKVCPEDGQWEDYSVAEKTAQGAYLRIASTSISSNGGANSIQVEPNQIPLMSIRLGGEQSPNVVLWGGGGTARKTYSFATADGGSGGASSYEARSIVIGIDKSAQQPLKIEPTYVSMVLCRRKP
jgi:hypothetical protein